MRTVAVERAGYSCGRWTINYPGDMEEHVTVMLGDEVCELSRNEEGDT